MADQDGGDAGGSGKGAGTESGTVLSGAATTVSQVLTIVKGLDALEGFTERSVVCEVDNVSGHGLGGWTVQDSFAVRSGRSSPRATASGTAKEYVGTVSKVQGWHSISSGGGVCRRNFGSHSRKNISSRLAAYL
jgi:hypothetical protein